MTPNERMDPISQCLSTGAPQSHRCNALLAPFVAESSILFGVRLSMTTARVSLVYIYV